jgi:hypothetical protein
MTGVSHPPLIPPLIWGIRGREKIMYVLYYTWLLPKKTKDLSVQTRSWSVKRIPYCLQHRVHTEWQLPLSGVHSIMMEKLAQDSVGGGARPPPFAIVTITYKVAVYAPAERADTIRLFLLYPYVLCGLLSPPHGEYWNSKRGPRICPSFLVPSIQKEKFPL